MVFSSPLFILLFLPLAILVFYVLPLSYRNPFLLLASLFFYAWGEDYYVIVLLISILLNWFWGQLIPRMKNNQSRITFLATGIALNIAMLVVFKYSNFLVDNLNVIMSLLNLTPIKLASVHLPIGISFFVFQGISYLVDVYRTDVEPTKSLLKFAMYKSFFPQLIAGPIVRYKDVCAQIDKRIFSVPQFAEGVERFIFGLGKKVIIANTAGTIADKIFAENIHNLNAPVAWLGILCYALQIYFDFSGYSDMAIGMAKMFGFNFLENFNYPYISTSLKEFWRRWHISLSTWFRDYLYIPLGGNRTGKFWQYFNLTLVFFLCGFWHGASWTFIIWGLWNGLFLVLERTFFGTLLARLWRPIQYCYALLVIMIGWVFFRADSFNQAIGYISSMFGRQQNWKELNILFYLNPYSCFVLTIGILFATPLFPYLKEKMADKPLDKYFLIHAVEIGRIALLMLILTYSISNIAMGTNNPFIYFRF